ncbi:MAG: PAS domain-containing protein [Rhizobiaceae bacterium]
MIKRNQNPNSDPVVARHTMADLASALDDVPVLIWLSEDDYGGTHFNRTWLEFTGRTLAQEIDGGWMSGLHADDVGAVEAYADALKKRKPFQAEYRLRRHDGEWRWMLDKGRPRFNANGEFVGYVGSCVDITERKNAEAALLRSQERLSLAQEAASVGTYDWDVAENAIAWSPEMFRLHGIDSETNPDDIYGAWLERLHPEDRERADRETREFVNHADQLMIEFRIVHPDTGTRWIQGRGRVIRDDEGRPVRMIGVNFDVTEQRRTEEALKDSEQRLSDIAANFPGIIFRRITYPDGRVEYPYFSGIDGAVFHVAPERIAEIQTMEDVSSLIHFDDLPGMMNKFEQAAASLSPLDLEGRVVGDDGQVTWVRSLSRPHPGPDSSLIWDGVILDVTDRHRREGERERAATMLRMGMEVAGIGTWEFDPQNQTITGSGATNPIFGLPQDGLARPADEYFKAIHPDDADRIRGGLLDGTSREATIAREYRILAPDGTVRWVASQGSYRRLADGTGLMIGALFDNTERKQMEEDREAALDHQKMLLKELNHRVKNNLQMISSMMRLQLSRLSDADSRQALTSTIERVQAISDLQMQLGSEGRMGHIDFGAYLHELAEKFRNSVLAGTPIKLHCEVDHCILDLDRAMPLGLLVNELVTNAIKYAFPERDNGTISITLACDPEEFVVRIADNGCGIKVPDETRKGTGLGMKLVKGLSGQIGATVKSLEGQGTTFQITVPNVSSNTQGDI